MTGASRGIGRAIALDLANAGFDVVAAMRNPADGADLAAQVGDGGGSISVQRIDMDDPDTFVVPDGLRVLVNNAGIEREYLPVEHVDLADWRAVFETNLFGLVELTGRAIPVMRAGGGGVVCNVTSSSILAAIPFYSVYRASKAAASALPLVEMARPVLDTLRTTTGESVQLYVREGEGRRCVVSLESPHGLRWIVPEGSLLPLGAGSAGHVLEGERVDKRGWIQSIGEREAGVASVSAPVMNAQGIIVAAISVSGPIERLSRKPGERHGAAVVEAAKDLAKLL